MDDIFRAPADVADQRRDIRRYLEMIRAPATSPEPLPGRRRSTRWRRRRRASQRRRHNEATAADRRENRAIRRSRTAVSPNRRPRPTLSPTSGRARTIAAAADDQYDRDEIVCALATYPSINPGFSAAIVIMRGFTPHARRPARKPIYSRTPRTRNETSLAKNVGASRRYRLRHHDPQRSVERVNRTVEPEVQDVIVAAEKVRRRAYTMRRPSTAPRT